MGKGEAGVKEVGKFWKEREILRGWLIIN